MDELEVQLDIFTSFGTETPLHISKYNNEDVFVLNNVLNNSIDLYSIQRGIFIRRIKIPRSGPFAIKQIAGATFLDNDSLLVFNKFVPEKSVIFDLNGTALRDNLIKYKTFSNKNALNIVQTVFNDIGTIDDKVYFSSWPLNNTLIPQEKPTHRYIHSIDIENGLIDNDVLELPESYLKNGIFSSAAINLFKINSKSNEIVNLWPLSNTLQIKKLDSLAKWKSIGLKSDIDVSDPTVFNSIASTETQALAGATINIGLLVDESKGWYYVFKLLPVEPDQQSSIFDLYFKKPLSLEVYNNDIELIKKIDLGQKIYDPFKSFCYKGKIYISKCNIFNTNLDENLLVFDIFDFS